MSLLVTVNWTSDQQRIPYSSVHRCRLQWSR